MAFSLICSLQLIILISYSCSKSKLPEDIDSVYKNRAEILFSFRNKTIIRSRGQNIIIVYTYNASTKNEYFFDFQHGVYNLVKTEINFSPDFGNSFPITDSVVYRQEITNKIANYLDKMNSLGIRDVSAEFQYAGIDMKIYLVSNNICLYIPNPSGITGKPWRKYFKSLKKIDTGWYYESD